MGKSCEACRKIASHWLLTSHGLLRDGILCIDGDGTVTDILHGGSVDSMEGVEFYAGILIPGMVNAHTHLELSYLRGAIGRGGGFAGFGESMGRLRGGFPERETERAADVRDAMMWQSGTQAAADICNGALTFPVKRRSNMEYVNFIEIFGLSLRSPSEALETAARAGEAALSAFITPHSTYSLNDDLFRRAVSLSEGPLSIHFMESEAERDLYRRRGPMWQWYEQRGFRIDFERYGSPARRIVECIPAHRNIMLVHNTFVSSEETDMLNAHFGSRLTWVLCPRSNAYIENAYPPVEMLRAKGCRIAVGTDSLASNDDLSLINELKAIKDVPLEEMLGWATAAGAEALGLGRRLGMLEKGRRPGVVLLEGVDTLNMRLTDRSRTRRLV